MVEAAGVDELKQDAETPVSVQRWQKRHFSAAYNRLTGRCREDRLCLDLHHEGQNTFYC